MKRATLILFAAVLGLRAIGAFAQEPHVSIRLYDEQIYFPDSAIDILVTVQNDTPEPIHFRLADDRRFNVSFAVRDERNNRLRETGELIIALQTNQRVFYRELTLQPGEQLSFVERLTDYISLDAPGRYTAVMTFYPELRNVAGPTAVRSDPISVTVRSGQTPEVRRQMRFEALTEDTLRRRQLSPDQVVEFMLRARQQSNWERFFLYLDLESLYRQTPARERRYVRLSQEEQIQELMEYREELRRQSVDEDSALVVVPDSFQIRETRYTPESGQVTARLFFNFDTYRERREYTYELQRRDGFWEIVGYQVSNLPNEALDR